MAKNRKFMVGTRGSPLALAQTRAWVAQWQQSAPDIQWELKVIITTGDKIQDRFLSTVGGKGLFVKEIETALLQGEIDLAVHSMKDLPGHMPEELDLLCIPMRASPWDVLISQEAWELKDLPKGAKVGTSSLRRRVQLKLQRPDLQFELLRGNIDTRIDKLRAGDFHAILLAQAGMERLGLDQGKAKRCPIIPAPGQGILAIQGRKEDFDLQESMVCLNHVETRNYANMERAVAQAFDGHCQLPLACFAQVQKGLIQLQIFLATPSGDRHLTWEGQCHKGKEQALVQQAVGELNQQGAQEILSACR